MSFLACGTIPVGPTIHSDEPVYMTMDTETPVNVPAGRIQMTHMRARFISSLH